VLYARRDSALKRHKRKKGRGKDAGREWWATEKDKVGLDTLISSSGVKCPALLGLSAYCH
jgi:hypothetical protein